MNSENVLQNKILAEGITFDDVLLIPGETCLPPMSIYRQTDQEY